MSQVDRRTGRLRPILPGCLAMLAAAILIPPPASGLHAKPPAVKPPPPPPVITIMALEGGPAPSRARIVLNSSTQSFPKSAAGEIRIAFDDAIMRKINLGHVELEIFFPDPAADGITAPTPHRLALDLTKIDGKINVLVGQLSGLTRCMKDNVGRLQYSQNEKHKDVAIINVFTIDNIQPDCRNPEFKSDIEEARCRYYFFLDKLEFNVPARFSTECKKYRSTKERDPA